MRCVVIPLISVLRCDFSKCDSVPKGRQDVATGESLDVTQIFSIRIQPQRGLATKPGVAVTTAYPRKSHAKSVEPRRATRLRIHRHVFTGFLEVPSPPGKGEKVAGGRMRGLFAGSNSIKLLTALPNRGSTSPLDVSVQPLKVMEPHWGSGRSSFT